ncbi:MAG: hypothetical protein ACLPSW_23585 [Roseiarcus sp.]
MLLCANTPAAANDPSPLDQIQTIAANSKCGRVAQSPKAFMRGIALVFAKAVCEPERADVKLVSAASGSLDPNPERTDALTWYEDEFGDLNMSNDKAGEDTLRHSYALMIGLAMRESSGRYCVGRDRTAHFDKASTAEAGVFQTSWGAHKISDTLKALNDKYASTGKGCLLEVFSKNVSCSKWDAINWGDATKCKDDKCKEDVKEGVAWQSLTKACPSYATEYAAVLVRKSGGRLGEFGPLRHHDAKIYLQCDSMLSEIQTFVAAHPETCAALK